MEHIHEVSLQEFPSSGSYSNYQNPPNYQSNVVNQPYPPPVYNNPYGSNSYVQPISYPPQPTMNLYQVSNPVQNPSPSYPQNNNLAYGNPQQLNPHPLQKPTQYSMDQQPRRYQSNRLQDE